MTFHWKIVCLLTLNSLWNAIISSVEAVPWTPLGQASLSTQKMRSFDVIINWILKNCDFEFLAKFIRSNVELVSWLNWALVQNGLSVLFLSQVSWALTLSSTERKGTTLALKKCEVWIGACYYQLMRPIGLEMPTPALLNGWAELFTCSLISWAYSPIVNLNELRMPLCSNQVLESLNFKFKQIIQIERERERGNGWTE